MRRVLLALLLLLVTTGAAARYAFHILLEQPVDLPVRAVRIDVERGQTFGGIAQRLENAGLIRNARALVLWARWAGSDRRIQPGAYRFDERLSALEILEKMRNGEAMIVRVTLPEGLTAREIASVLARQGIGTETEYEALFADADFVRSLGLPTDSPEGYLFPDTYFFSPLDSPRKVLVALTDRFQRVLAEVTADVGSSDLDVHEMVTLASIVEKETAAPEERPMIAAVFRNRLRLGMPLQSDPTVIYGVSDFDGNLTRRHLETPTPYNTYSRAGLPPGPIANPGRESLRAVLHPAEGHYLYFVSRNDGSHEFSTNLSDHNRAVNRYQRSRRASGPS